MKVLHLINNLKREGAQTVVLNLVTCGNRQEQVEHSVCVRQPNGPLRPRLQQCSIPVFAPERYYGMISIIRMLGFIDRLIEDQGFDVIHAHLADAALLGWYVARKNSLPLLITHHGNHLLPDCGALCRRFFLSGLKIAANYAYRNVAVSASVAQQLKFELALSPEKVIIIPNGVPVPATINRGLSRSPERSAPSIVTVGRLVSLKGYDQLISAALTVVEKYDNARFVIVGEGPLEQELKQTIERSGLAGHMRLVGPTDDVPSFLRGADVYVSTSHYEGMPLSVLEAMAWCVPVIVSDVPGNNDVVEHNISGLLYRLGDSEALAEAIAGTIQSPGTAAKRALVARQMVQDKYSTDIATDSYGALYADAIASKN